MPIIRSAKKQMRQSRTKRARNVVTKKFYREAVKSFLLLIEDGKKAEATKLYPKVQKLIDLAVKKNILHKNTAGRMKSSLAKKIAA